MKHTLLPWLACAMLGLMTGCGPGTGGTGTGLAADRLTSFGATAASVCTATVADALNCPTLVQIPDITQGTLVVYFADTKTGGNVTVRFADNSIELNAPCLRLRFEGDWGISASNDARFFGHYTLGSDPSARRATLSVATLQAGALHEMSVTLRTEDGQVVLGPITLQQTALPTVPTMACP